RGARVRRCRGRTASRRRRGSGWRRGGTGRRRGSARIDGAGGGRPLPLGARLRRRGVGVALPLGRAALPGGAALGDRVELCAARGEALARATAPDLLLQAHHLLLELAMFRDSDAAAREEREAREGEAGGGDPGHGVLLVSAGIGAPARHLVVAGSVGEPAQVL